MQIFDMCTDVKFVFFLVISMKNKCSFLHRRLTPKYSENINSMIYELARQ